MGASISKALKPQELFEYKGLQNESSIQNIINIPELSSNRKSTDKKFLVFFILSVILLLPFLLYTLMKSDIELIDNMFDPCGNICGKENMHYDEWNCTGKNFTLEKYLEYEDRWTGDELLTPRNCVSECHNGSILVGSKCLDNGTFSLPGLDKMFDDLSTSFHKNSWRAIPASLLSFGVAVAIFLLFRLVTTVIVWSIIVASFVVGAILIPVSWFICAFLANFINNKEHEEFDKLHIFFFIFVILYFIMFIVVIFIRKRIGLATQFIKETTKAAFDMPLLIFLPLITSLVVSGILYTFLLASFAIYFSGTLQPLAPNFLYYGWNATITFTMIFNALMAIWAVQFVNDVQFMIISGAIAKWYFASDKRQLGDPILESATNVFKYHLGSVALGSLIIKWCQFFGKIITHIATIKCFRTLLECWVDHIEVALDFFSQKSYVLIAMHGKAFYKSGKRAGNIIYHNALHFVAIRCIARFVIFMAKVLVVLISMLITVAIMANTDEEDVNILTYLVVFIVAIVISITSFAIFETAVDTIFLCFCEDTLLNNGGDRPYAMSRNLMEFVETSKSIYGERLINKL